MQRSESLKRFRRELRAFEVPEGQAAARTRGQSSPERCLKVQRETQEPSGHAKDCLLS